MDLIEMINTDKGMHYLYQVGHMILVKKIDKDQQVTKRLFPGRRWVDAAIRREQC